MHCNASFLHRSAGNSAQILSVSAVVFFRDILEANLKKKATKQINKQPPPQKKKTKKTKQNQKNSQLEAKGKRIYFSSDYTTYFYSVFSFKF